MSRAVLRGVANLTERDLDAIRYIAEREGTSETVALQRSLHLRKMLLEETRCRRR